MKLKKIMMAMLVGFAFTSCEKDDPEVPHEHEVFSNVSLTLTPDGGGDEIEFHWHDENGDLVVDPDEIESGSLAANTTYNAVISFNEEEEEHDEHDHDEEEDEEHDHDDIDAEILTEATEHQLFYSTVSGLTITYNDEDTDGNPLGLKTIFITDDTFNGGDLKVTLRHEPIKSAEGVSEGDITNAGGETDLEITFSL